MNKAIILLLLAVSAAHGVKGSLEPRGNFCQGCRSIVSYVNLFNTTNDRAEIKQLMSSFCDLYYPTSTDYQQGPCPMFVQGVLLLVDNIDPVTHCDEIGACGPMTDLEATNEVASMVNDKPEPFACTFCEDIVKQTKSRLTDPQFVSFVKNKINALCDFLKVVDQDKQCKQVLSNNFDEAIDFIRDLKPRAYCKAIKLCPPAPPSRSLLSAIRRPQLADYAGFGLETKVEIGSQVIRDSNTFSYSKPQEPVGCVLCKTVVGTLLQILGKNYTEQNIEYGLDKVCDVAYHDKVKRSHCHDLVQTYSRELIQLLQDNASPLEICILIDQCVCEKCQKGLSNSMSVTIDKPSVTLSEFMSMLDPSVEVGSIANCMECKLFVDYLKDELSDVKSQEHTKQWLLTNLCQKLDDKDLKDSCMQMVETYSAAFFKAIIGELQPKTVCKEVGCCEANMPFTLTIDASPTTRRLLEVVQEEPKPVRVADKPCDQCVDIVTQIDEYLSNHSIDHDVSVLVDEVCNKFASASLRDECTLLIKAFGQDISEVIATMDNPRQVCHSFGLC